jgi:ring-1,2-phenylacetyl-CoA epoxidase subunit PaaE
MSKAAAVLRGWFTEPPPTFELRRPSARWGTPLPRETRRTLRVVDVVEETPTVRTYVLEAVGPGAPLRYLAGQHLTLLVDIGGVTHRRCYSFSTSPAAAARPAITVRRMPEGVVSRHLHDHLRVGDTLVATEPTGQFTLATDPEARRSVVFVAGGVGITPLVSLAETLLRDDPGSRAILLCGHRSEPEIIFRDRLAALEAEFCPRLVVRHALDLPPPGWNGLAGVLDGERVLETLGPDRADAYYVCGPELMMQSVRSALEAAGVHGERIHTERFAYASATTTPIPVHAAEIAFAVSGRRIVARPGQTILQAGLEAGVNLPFSCTMGGCGACKVRVSSGRSVMSEPNCLTAREREDGYVLACCCYADTALTIENH